MSSFLLPCHFDVFDNDKWKLPHRLLRGAFLTSLVMALFLVANAPAQADATQISGGLDGRAMSQDPLWGAGEEGIRLHGAFLNLRHVISDKSGDRCQ